jgi:hypothetical protein
VLDEIGLKDVQDSHFLDIRFMGKPMAVEKSFVDEK